MEILVGRGGNQSMNILDEQVSRIHCKIEVLDSGFYAVTNLSPAGTWLNGTRLLKRTLVQPHDTLRLGPTFTATVEQLMAKTNVNIFTWHQLVLQKYPSAHELQVFINTSINRTNSPMAAYVMPVVKSAMAFCLIDEGKYWEAQSLIYEAGDALYDLQDGSPMLQCVYASSLVVCARLYVAIHRIDVAQEAIIGAVGVFDRLPRNVEGCSEEQRKEAYQLAVEVLSLLGQDERAKEYRSKL